jgi:peptidoglycan biosynthesis protein MviN/MurJ (putative lipid II flippase)
LFGVAIASAAARDMEEFRSTLARSLGLVFLLTVPCSAIR